MTLRIWSPVGRCSSSNASFEISFSSDAASALDEKRQRSLSASMRGNVGNPRLAPRPRPRSLSWLGERSDLHSEPGNLL